MTTVHLIIKGKVQGVFYRATAKETAQKTGITGWIRNTAEGAVEAVASGTEEGVQQFIDWCRKGPSGARVAEVVTNRKEAENFDSFRILR